MNGKSIFIHKFSAVNTAKNTMFIYAIPTPQEHGDRKRYILKKSFDFIMSRFIYLTLYNARTLDILEQSQNYQKRFWFRIQSNKF